jgi:hypothetical protein
VTAKPQELDLGMREDLATASDLGMGEDLGTGSVLGAGADKRRAGDSHVAASVAKFEPISGHKRNA